MDTSASSPPSLGPGMVLEGRFLLEAKLGEGGMGSVFRAWDPKENRPVAIKCLKDASSLERFRNEAEAARRVEHPGIVKVLECHDAAVEVPYLVMELIEGEDLGHLLKGKTRWPFEEVRYVGDRLLDILGAVHETGIVHRDLKPGNVMMSGAHAIKLLDFGIAKFPDQAGRTVSGTTLGTPGFIPPEQYGEPWAVNRQADLWAAGAILYLLLTDEMPFPSGREAALSAKEPFLLKGVPRDVNAFFRRALAGDLQARFTSAEEMRQALDQIDEFSSDRIRIARPRGRAFSALAAMGVCGMLAYGTSRLFWPACPDSADHAWPIGRTLAACEKAQQRFRSTNDLYREGQTLFTIGDLHVEQKELEDATKAYKEGLPKLIRGGARLPTVYYAAWRISSVRTSPELLAVIQQAAELSFGRKFPALTEPENAACAAALFQRQMFAALHEEARNFGFSHVESLKALAAADANAWRLAKTVPLTMWAIYYSRIGDTTKARAHYNDLLELLRGRNSDDRPIDEPIAESGLLRLDDPGLFKGCFGVVVNQMKKDSAADKAGLRDKDILLKMNDLCLGEFEDVLPLKSLPRGKWVTFVGLRRNELGRYEEVKTYKQVEGLGNEATLGAFFYSF